MEQTDQVALPWLREQGALAWQGKRPTVVLMPSRTEGFYLRERLLSEKKGLLGVHFWTPSDARKFLLSKSNLTLTPASQTELRLMARTCTERLQKENPEERFFNGVVREPTEFLRSYDLLVSTGWDAVADNRPENRRLSEEFSHRLGQVGRGTQAQIHRQLLQGEKSKLIARLLIVGFNATHWPLWDLLRATAHRAEQVTCSLLAPHVFAEKIDQLWISSWEMELKTTVQVMPSQLEAGVFSPLAQAYERADLNGRADQDVTFLVARDVQTHASAVVRQALVYLRKKECTRLGILFPETDALALEVAEQFRQLGVPMDEGTGFFMPDVFSARSWSTWLKLQGEWTASSFIAWARAVEAEGAALSLPARQIAGKLDAAWGETLVEDLDFLASWLEKKADENTRKLVQMLREQIRLPSQQPLTAFLECTEQALQHWTKEEQRASLASYAPHWKNEAEMPLSRSAFLDWLREATAPRERKRGPEGNHFYGKVHLLSYAQMTGQTWSHLILTELNEKIWPRSREPGGLEAWQELNRRALRLNRQALTSGTQGEGHEVVAEGHGYGLTSQDKEDLAWRDLCAALEETRSGLCLTAALSEAGRGLLPNDFFAQLYRMQTGRVLDEATFRALAQATSSWCVAEKTEDAELIPQVRKAYEQRRNSLQPFGPYEFSFQEPPAEPIQLSCKQWEDALQFPAQSWLRYVVGVVPWPEESLPWPRAIGTWVHLWLAHALGKRKDSASWITELQVEAERFQAQQEKELRALGQELPPWWRQIRRQAQRLAEQLAASLDPVLPGWEILSEMKLPADVRAALPETPSTSFRFKGQPDLVLRQDAQAWVIDFKTGRPGKLNRKTEGRGLQVILYGLAIRKTGASQVQLSLLAPGTELKPGKELALEEIDLEIYRSLDLVHRAGIFGQKPLPDDYAFAPPLPLTTLSPHEDVLNAKWNLLRGESEAEEEKE